MKLKFRKKRKFTYSKMQAKFVLHKSQTFFKNVCYLMFYIIILLVQSTLTNTVTSHKGQPI